MDKIKLFFISDKGKDILTFIIIVMVGLVSFGLGRLSTKGKYGDLKIEQTTLVPTSGPDSVVEAPKSPKIEAETPKLIESPKVDVGAYFASKIGTKYYFSGCSGGKTIKPENKIYFDSKEEAERAGYELSATCRD